MSYDPAMALTRSQIMSRVRGRGNKSTEEKLARLFRKSGIKGWRRQIHLPGTPDFAFPKHRVVIFVDGCFWHGCPRHATYPKTRRAFWLGKLVDNRVRDRRVGGKLRRHGWRVVRIWECELKKQPQRCILKIEKAIKQSDDIGKSQADK